VQGLAGIVVGMIGTAWFVTEQAATAPRAEQVQLSIAATLGVVAGGLVVWDLTRRSLRKPWRKEALRCLGWSTASGRSMLAACVAGLALALVMIVVINPAFPRPPDSRWEIIRPILRGGGWPRHLFAVVTILLGPPVEEFLFRGVIFTALARSWGAVLAATVATVLFAAGHLPQMAGYGPAIVGAVVVGFATLLARTSTGSLLPAVVLHAAYNGAFTATVYLAAPLTP
jgi:CAAX protease family protein